MLPLQLNMISFDDISAIIQQFTYIQIASINTIAKQTDLIIESTVAFIIMVFQIRKTMALTPFGDSRYRCHVTNGNLKG